MTEHRKLFAAGMAVTAILLIVAVATLMIIASSNNAGSTGDGSSAWSYPDVTLEAYEAYHSLPHPQVTTEDLAAIVEPNNPNPYVIDIAQQMSSPQDVVAFLKAHIAFATDADVYGKSDYWASPTETLFNHRGDCDDFAILTASILSAMGYEPEILLMSAEPTGHMAVLLDGVYLDPLAVHGQPPINADPVTSILGVKILSNGEIKQRLVEKTEIFS